MKTGLLLLHAFPLDATMWEPQVHAFSADLPVVAPDLPGFGSAPGAGEVMTMDAAAEHALHALDRAGVDRAVVCGLSMGGYVALALWRKAADRVAGLVLANTKASADDEAAKQRRRDLARRLSLEGSDFLVANPPPLLSANADRLYWDRVRRIIRNQQPHAIAAASLGMAERPDSNHDLPNIKVPVLVVTSSADTLIPPDQTKDMAWRLPDSRVEEIAGVGHLSNIEADARFNDLLRGHLKRCGALAERGAA